MTTSNQLRTDQTTLMPTAMAGTDDWLLPERSSVLTRWLDVTGDGVTGPPDATAHTLMTRSIRAIANADIAAIATPRDSSSLHIKEIDPPECELDLGHRLFRSTPAAKEIVERGTMELLLEGDLQWCRAIPPPGFAHCALLSLPGRWLCIVANRQQQRPFYESDLTRAVAFAADLMPVALFAETIESWKIGLSAGSRV